MQYTHCLKVVWLAAGRALLLVPLLTACEPETETGATVPAVSTPHGAPIGAVAGSGVVSVSGAAGSGISAVNPPATPASSAPPGAPNVPGVPCDVAAVVSENCTTCHSNPTKYQAPMPLMAYADFMAASKTMPARKVFQVIPERINAADVKLRMPPASGASVSPAGLKAFNDWLASGANAVTPSCAIVAKGAPAQPPTGGTVPPSPTNGTTTPTSAESGTSSTKIDYNDPLMKCYEFRAHAAGNNTMPYSVSTQPDQYTNFIFKAPWQGSMYSRSYRVLDGNAKVIHHWLLYKNSAAVANDSVGPSSGAHPDGELVHGWAPGGSDLYLAPDVGIEMPSTVGYTLETHHNNTTGAPAPDNSGVEVCVTPTAPKNVASLSWLGTDAITGTSASGVCTPTSKQPIHVLAVTPHMHTKGVHMTAEITRAGGKKEMLHDAPFDFAFQHSYQESTILMPGDSIKTTCQYSAPASFGEGTSDEMCYLFTLYYPKLALTNGNPIGTLIHGPNTCLQ